jgi:hypothetical protein
MDTGVGQVQRPQSGFFDVMGKKGGGSKIAEPVGQRILGVHSSFLVLVTTTNGKRKGREQRNWDYATATILGVFIRTTYFGQGSDTFMSFQTRERHQFFDQQLINCGKLPLSAHPPVGLIVK